MRELEPNFGPPVYRPPKVHPPHGFGEREFTVYDIIRRLSETHGDAREVEITFGAVEHGIIRATKGNEVRDEVRALIFWLEQHKIIRPVKVGYSTKGYAPAMDLLTVLSLRI